MLEQYTFVIIGIIVVALIAAALYDYFRHPSCFGRYGKVNSHDVVCWHCAYLAECMGKAKN